MTMHQLAVVDQRRDLDLLERNLILTRTPYTITYGPWSDEFADGWHWVLSADLDCPPPQGQRAA
jgi:hypothetical protein